MEGVSAIWLFFSGDWQLNADWISLRRTSPFGRSAGIKNIHFQIIKLSH